VTTTKAPKARSKRTTPPAPAAATPTVTTTTAKKSAAKPSAAKKRAAAKPRRERVLITGAAGGLGRLLCSKLHRHFDVISIDSRPFPDRPKDVEHFEVDLRRKAAMQALKKKRADVVIHLGMTHGGSGARAFSFNVESTAQLLKLTEQMGARKLVFLSSAALYGPSATSSGFLTEEAPLLGAGTIPAMRDLASLDMMVQSFFWKAPDIETVILRPVHMVGPHLNNPSSRYLRAKRIPRLMGFNPMIQLIHELDVVEAIELATKRGVRGVFNLVGPGQAPLSRLIEARGAVDVPVPGPLLKMWLGRAQSLRLTHIHEGDLAHLRYSCLVEGKRAHDELGFTPRLSLMGTIADL
jgi:UDP-glucose 4-epimerase